MYKRQRSAGAVADILAIGGNTHLGVRAGDDKGEARNGGYGGQFFKNINYSIPLPFVQPSSQTATQPCQPTNQPTNQPTDPPTDQPTPTNRPTDQSTNQQTHQRTNQRTNRPTNQRTNQPINQPTSLTLWHWKETVATRTRTHRRRTSSRQFSAPLLLGAVVYCTSCQACIWHNQYCVRSVFGHGVAATLRRSARGSPETV